jgi:hypothetical protein
MKQWQLACELLYGHRSQTHLQILCENLCLLTVINMETIRNVDVIFGQVHTEMNHYLLCL